MFGLLYIDEETQKKLNKANAWQDAFLERCKKAEEKEKRKKLTKNKAVNKISGNEAAQNGLRALTKN